MAWARISDDFHDHPKVSLLTVDDEGRAAFGLWLLALTWVRADFRRKGVVPEGQVYRLGGSNAKQLASRLVQVRLWDEVEGGYRFHDYDDVYTPDGLSSKRAAAGRAGGKASGRTRRSAAEAKQDGSKPEASCFTDEAESVEATTKPRTRARASTTHSPGGTSTYTGSAGQRTREAPPDDRQPRSLTEQIVADYRGRCERPPPADECSLLAGKVHPLVTVDGFTRDEVWAGVESVCAKGLGFGALPGIMSELFCRATTVAALDRQRALPASRASPSSGGTDANLSGWATLAAELRTGEGGVP